MAELLMLDTRTLAFVSAVSGFLMAMTMFGIYMAGMRHRALVDWSIAGLTLGFGYLVGHMLQTLPVPVPVWWVGGLANALIGLGHGFILIGVQRYLGRPVWARTVLVIVLLMFISGFLTPELRESLRHRIIIHSGWYVLIDAWAGWLLWRARRPGMQLFHRVAAAILITYAIFLSLRLGYAVVSPALTTSFVQDPFQIAAFLAAMIFGICLTMALAVMLFREKQLELELQARRDPLTGMNNRLSLNEVARMQLAGATRRRSTVSVMLFDLDYFKQINDRYGHQAGDTVLKAVADCVEGLMRGSDAAFRIGGEEFMVILPDADAEQAACVAERFRVALSEIEVDFGSSRPRLTASFGVVEWRGSPESWEELVRRADKALYQAKQQGRDQVVTPIHLALVGQSG